jgi:hypothetical protein
MTITGRIKPPMGHDNGWWWQRAAEGVLAIQRCAKCGTLRHPPRPMCSECRTLEWDHVAASGRGTVASYTVLYHPRFPGYEYPLIIVLVDLDEGVRITAELKDALPRPSISAWRSRYIRTTTLPIPMFRLTSRGGN